MVLGMLRKDGFAMLAEVIDAFEVVRGEPRAVYLCLLIAVSPSALDMFD